MCLKYDDGASILPKTLSLSPLYIVSVDDYGEALGLFHALQWISIMQFNDVNFVTDFKTTVDAFHTT
jgi:ribonuclease HI